MKLISVKLPNGKEPKWDDAMMLNIGVGVLPEFEVLATDQEWLVPEDQPFASIIHMTVFFHFSKGRYVAKFVGLEAHPEVTGTDLREIRVAEVLRLAASAGIYVKLDKDDPPAPIREWWGEDDFSVAGSDMEKLIKSAGPVEWVLREVALVYNIAQVSSQHPAKAVEKRFNLSARTAARWIAKAKEEGILRRPSIPGWEEIVEGSDRIPDKVREINVLGQRYARKVHVENIKAVTEGIKAKTEEMKAEREEMEAEIEELKKADGEHSEASER